VAGASQGDFETPLVSETGAVKRNDQLVVFTARRLKMTLTRLPELLTTVTSQLVVFSMTPLT
jgi:hypothetical protein